MKAVDTSKTTLAAEGTAGPPRTMRVILGILSIGILDM